MIRVSNGDSPILRRAAPADAARLALLGGTTFLDSFAHDHPGDAIVAHVDANHSREWYAARLHDPAYAIWILESHLAAPLGYAVLSPPDLDCPFVPGDLELKRLYVLSRWQAGGHGAQMLRAVADEAKARGAGRLLLSVYSENHAAQRFYARHGFEDTGIGQLFKVGGVPFQDLIWAKPLGEHA